MRKSISSRFNSVLMYHGISNTIMPGMIAGEQFERQIIFLKKYFQFASISNPFSSISFHERKIFLTFDDGFRNNFHVVAPILKRHGIPAVFFVSTRHCESRKYLWFSYLQGLKNGFRDQGFRWRNKYYEMAGKSRAGSILNVRKKLLEMKPHPVEMYRAIDRELPSLEDFVPEEVLNNWYAGMSFDDLHELAQDPLFTIGIHTLDHVYLTKCADDVIYQQIQENLELIDKVTGAKPFAIAYPGGDYNNKVIEICKTLKIQFGFAVEPIRDNWTDLEIPRIGVYKGSLIKLLIKSVWAQQIRKYHLKIG